MYIAGLVGPYAAIITVINWLVLPGVRLPAHPLGYASGGMLVGAGVACVGIAYRQLWRAEREGTLCRRGLFGIVRHPMYAGWIWLIVPGTVLLLRLPLLGTVLPVMASVTVWSLPVEEQPLEETFGDAYTDYRQQVNAIVPTLALPEFPRAETNGRSSQ